MGRDMLGSGSFSYPSANNLSRFLHPCLSLPYFGQERKLQDLEVELAARTKDIKARLAQLDAQVREAEAGSTLPWGGGLSTEGRLYLPQSWVLQSAQDLSPSRKRTCGKRSSCSWMRRGRPLWRRRSVCPPFSLVCPPPSVHLSCPGPWDSKTALASITLLSGPDFQALGSGALVGDQEPADPTP